MANWLIRSVKIRQELIVFGIPSIYNQSTITPMAGFKDVWADEWIIDTEDLESTDLQFLVNAIVHSERQLYLGAFHCFITCFDMAHYVSLDNDSGCVVMVAKGSTEEETFFGPVEANSNWGHINTPTSDGSYTTVQLFENPPNYDFKTRASNGFDNDGALGIRALTASRDTYEGQAQKKMFYHCVGYSDCDITKKGTITLHGGGNLLSTRWKRFKLFSRYWEHVLTSYGIDKDGYLTYRPYAVEKFIASHVSDMKTSFRKYATKSAYSRSTHSILLKSISDVVGALKMATIESEQLNYSIEGLVTYDYTLSNFKFHLTIVIAQLINWFPYLVNDMDIEKEIIDQTNLNENNYLVPESNYEILKKQFLKIYSYYKWFDYYCENADRVRYYVAGRNVWPENLPLNMPQHLNYAPNSFPLPYQTPQVIRDRIEFWRANFWTAHQYMIQFLNCLAKIERVWNVRSWDASLNTRPAKQGNQYIGEKWHRRSIRGGDTSGISYPSEGIHAINREPYLSNKWKLEEDMVMGEVSPDTDLFIFWGAIEFSNFPISPPRYVQAPPPPVAPKPARKPFIWDNTIHPLTAEEEDAEAISLLEEIEENVRAVGHAEWGLTKAIVKLKGGKIPPFASDIVEVGIDYIADEINPTDRTKIRIPGTLIIVSDDGSIPTTFDGKKIEIG